jgi:hypothetical protein
VVRVRAIRRKIKNTKGNYNPENSNFGRYLSAIMKLGLFTADGLKVLAVLSVVGIFGYVMYHVATDEPDRWQSSILDIDEDLANSHCNDNYQCEDDLKVALAGCLAVHRHDEYARDAVYGC